MPFKPEELKEKQVVSQKSIRFCRLAETYQATCLLDTKVLNAIKVIYFLDIVLIIKNLRNKINLLYFCVYLFFS